MVWVDLSEPDVISKVLLRGSQEGGIGGHVAIDLEVGAMQPEASRNGADSSSPAPHCGPAGSLGTRSWSFVTAATGNSDAIEGTGVRFLVLHSWLWALDSFLGGQMRRVRA